jgi:hypothetical protein
MANAFIIETGAVTAGIIALQDRGGFRFYASHPAMYPLDGQIFRSVKAAERAAAERLGKTGAGRACGCFPPPP